MVRNVWLPMAYNHGEIPNTKHLLASRQIKDWINDYRPAPGPIVRPKLDVEI